MIELLPLFVNVAGRRVVLVGGGRVATGKLQQLLAAGARVTVVAPEIADDIVFAAAADAAAVASAAAADAPDIGAAAATANGRFTLDADAPPGLQRRIELCVRTFQSSDLDDAWLVVAAATADVNREVALAAEARHIFVNAVDDPANASAFLSGVVRRDGVTIAISTSGDAPALTSLLREALDALLPRDLAAWMARARTERREWRREGVPMPARKPRLLRALNDMYAPAPVEAGVPWLHAPEDSWL